MFSKEDIQKKHIEKEDILELKKAYAARVDTNTDINAAISKILVHINTIEGIPKFVLTRAIYRDNNNGISMIRITLRPSKSYILTTKEMKRVETFVDITDFYNSFIDFIIEWVEDYIKYAKIELNMNEFNSYIEDIIYEHGIKFDVRFTVGNIIEEIHSNRIKIGLQDNVALNIESIKESINKEDVVSTFNACSNVYDILCVRTKLTEVLSIYNRKSVIKLLRTYVKKDIRNVRVGIGYIETDDKFGIVERVAVREDEVDKIKQEYDIAVIEDNINITKREKEKEKTKVVSFYRVKPFNKY